MHKWLDDRDTFSLVNMSEHSIGDLGVVVQRNMKEFNVPMNQRHWCMKWCKHVHNVLAMEKIKWRTQRRC